MKKIKKYLLLLLVIGFTSCGSEFLDEKPLDFLSTANAFNTKQDFDASINDLYALVRYEFYTRNDFTPMEYLYHTDIAIQVANGNSNFPTEFGPNSGLVNFHWLALYKIAAEANTVISRIPGSSLSDSDKILFEAKGKFFRAFAYRCLAYLYGGVPLITEEIVTEKLDFVRATRAEVYAQVISDLIFCTANLPLITAVKDGEVSNLVAQHLLAEVYLADGQFQNAVDAATSVIDDPNTDLTINRYGSSASKWPSYDVYFDLFQPGNQNRIQANNKEALWVIQIETDVIGGSAVSTQQFGSYLLERVHAPLIRDLQLETSTPGVYASVFEWPVSDLTGGRGVGFLAPSNYWITQGYDDPTNDIRNANHNFVRKFKSTKIGSPFFGQEIDFGNLPAAAKGTGGTVVTSGVQHRTIYPYQSKCTTPGAHPTNLYVTAAYPNALNGGNAGGTYADQYMIRLAETYLIRAEGYLGLSNTTLAAADINSVRARSNAAPVLAANVDIDYILDERMREFGVEEKRMFTLTRLGQVYDRIVKCNPYYNGANGGTAVQPYNNLWAIPQPQIERNRGAVLTQNPGYPGAN
ncbi:MAG: RagB/SusD family nutrient uptake outer membrane protein [Chryseolinea sp.]